jgi:hypothetical protein
MPVATDTRTSTITAHTKSSFKRKFEEMQQRKCVPAEDIGTAYYDWFRDNNLLDKARRGLLGAMSSQAKTIVDSNMAESYRSTSNFMHINRITTEHHLVPLLHSLLQEYEQLRSGSPYVCKPQATADSKKQKTK